MKLTYEQARFSFMGRNDRRYVGTVWGIQYTSLAASAGSCYSHFPCLVSVLHCTHCTCLIDGWRFAYSLRANVVQNTGSSATLSTAKRVDAGSNVGSSKLKANRGSTRMQIAWGGHPCRREGTVPGELVKRQYTPAVHIPNVLACRRIYLVPETRLHFQILNEAGRAMPR